MRSSRSPSWYAEVPARTPAAPRAPGGGLRSCTAVDADTGRRCRLPAHADQEHAHERGRFTRVAAPGQVSFPKVEELVAAATSRREVGELGQRLAKHRAPDPVESRRRTRARAVAAAEVAAHA